VSVFRHGRSWWYNFIVRKVRYCERTQAAFRAEAQQLEVLRKAELKSAHTPLKRSSRIVTFRQFAMGDFASWSAVEHRDCSSTHARYMRSIKVLVAYFNEEPLPAINPGYVEQFKIWRSQQTRKHAKDGHLVTPAAVNRDLAALRILFNYAVRLGILAKNPVVEVRFFRERNQCTRVLSVEEEKEYLGAGTPFLRDVAIVMLETGMRPGEVYRSRRDDINLELRSAQIRSGKTVNASRYLPLTERALAILRVRVADATTEWLFPSPSDACAHVLDVRKSHDGAIRRAKIVPSFRLYDLRHTALTRMAMAGIDLPTLKELAGHSQIQMTMRYVHPTPEHKRRAIETFEGFRRTLTQQATSSQG
jgi:integrase